MQPGTMYKEFMCSAFRFVNWLLDYFFYYNLVNRYYMYLEAYVKQEL